VAARPSAGPPPSVVTAPVGLVDLAPTFCAIAGLDVPEWAQGTALPVDDADAGPGASSGSSPSGTASCSASTSTCGPSRRDGWVCTAYRAGTVHDGTEGELYDLTDDPLQQHNRWDDPSLRAQRDDLLDDLRTHEPPTHDPRLALEAPV
jgi:arylsulfatase A-like enzyme